MKMHALFSEHPASVGETYGEHLATAGGFSARLFVGAAACLVHAVLPFLFVRTGSSIIAELHDRMVVNRARTGAAGGSPNGERSPEFDLARSAPE